MDAAEFRWASLGYQVNHLARLLEQELRRAIEPFGVVPGQFPALLALFEQEPLTQRELCDRVGIEQPTMANTLQRMERDGLIHRAPAPDDRRRTSITLTDRARDMREELVVAAGRVNQRAAAGLDDATADQVLTAVRRMIAGMESTD